MMIFESGHSACVEFSRSSNQSEFTHRSARRARFKSAHAYTKLMNRKSRNDFKLTNYGHAPHALITASRSSTSTTPLIVMSAGQSAQIPHELMTNSKSSTSTAPFPLGGGAISPGHSTGSGVSYAFTFVPTPH